MLSASIFKHKSLAHLRLIAAAKATQQQEELAAQQYRHSTTAAATARHRRDKTRCPSPSTTSRRRAARPPRTSPSSVEGIDAETSVQVPIAHTTERRAQRQLAYDETTKTVNEWDDTIDAERKTSSLNFGKREAEQTSTSQLASSFFADTPLERRVEQILQQASAHNETAVKAREDDALGDDADERRKELAKTRSLLFFAERKAKYHAKVKSKAYARG